MTENVDIQFFAETGTWVKPSRAVRVDAVLQAGGGAGSAVFGAVGQDGSDGEITVRSFSAAALPDRMTVEVGAGGRGAGGAGDGASGYALILTHLAPEGEQ